MDSLIYIYIALGLIVVTVAFFFIFKKPRTTQKESLDQVPAPKPVPVRAATLADGLEKTRHSIWGRIASLLHSQEASKWDSIEEVLYSADLSVSMSGEILSLLKEKYNVKSGESWQTFLKEYFLKRLSPVILKQQDEFSFIESKNEHVPILMIAGVNGVGKTTTIGKIASKLSQNGKKIILAAGDTFRAAAKEQLQVWADRSGATLVAGKEGGDPSAIAFDAVKTAEAQNGNLIIFDTAGRLQNKSHLMDELSKVKRTLQKQSPHSALKTWMVIDATAGQNGLKQAEEFHKVMDLSGLIITKCDGSSKGGIVLSVMDQWKLPVVFIGVGEKVDDLKPFSLEEYLKALFD